MGKYVQVGVMAVRSPEGEFLPSEPIYKELPDDDPVENIDYISEDVLLDLFAAKIKNYIDRRKKDEV